MNKGANVGSLQTLQDLTAALKNFSRRRRELLDDLEAPLSRGVERLENRRDAWERELERRRDSYESAGEEDDRHYLQMQVEEAEENLQQVERWLDRVREAGISYTRCARTLSAGDDERAIAFLQDRIAELEKYLAIKVNSGATGSSLSFEGPGILPNALGALEQMVSSGFEGITESVLPAGFTWVPLSSIGAEEMANLPSDDDYPTVSKAEMQRGFETLRRDVLPAIQPGLASRDYFLKLDQEAGREYEHGTQRVYEAFFGDEPITLDRKLNGVEYGITSGGHRIKVAREQGWPAVPAKLI